MKSRMGVNHPQKTKYLHRLLAMLLCLSMVFTIFSGTLIYSAQAIDSSAADTALSDIKARLLEKIKNEKWDPYSEDMTLDEFYALMELFDERKLPLDSVANLALGDSGMEGPSIEGEANVIPRTMFMFSGLPTENEDGSPFKYQNGDEPLPYHDDGSDNYPNYPEGLDPYGLGYQVPPTSWAGVPIEAGKSQVVIAVEGQNNNDNSIAGNVVQSLFKDYQTNYGYYVRRVTAENNEATVLGAIKLPGQNKYVYYYLTDEKQSTDVSTTMLTDGKKFIVEYSPIEHTLEYEVHRDNINGADITNDPISVNVLGTNLSDTWENIVFGKSHPSKTDGSAYSFTASAPYDYTVEFYLVKTTDEENGAGSSGERTWGTPTALLGMDSAGSFNTVNGGWALGMEPDYKSNTAMEGGAIRPSNRGPSTLTMSGNIFNNNVHHDRKIIAVVHQNDLPTFFVAPIYHGTNNVYERGTSAYTQVRTADGQLVDYDYEDVYLWASGQQSKYQYKDSDATITGGGKGNIAVGNIATNDGWNWSTGSSHQYKDGPVSMTREADGTYSYQWTWQTNNSSGGYTMDSLEINGVAVTIPFFPKRSLRGDYQTGTSGGSTAWYTEADIGNGIHVKVEFLMVFNGGTPQRVYRITATGARSNVTISAMNLIMGTGAAEFVAYQFTGVTDNNGATAVEYYSGKNTWNSTLQGSITVHQNDNGINFSNGDTSLHGANIRFKLADGYASPYYLWESTQAGIISGQASAKRDGDGNVILTNLNPVISLDDVGDGMDSQHIYGPDDEGWYYIRVTTQENYKVALLTIGAKQVRYVVRYMPSTQDVLAPDNMPTFDHTGESDFEISSQYADQYDTKGGAYYDVTGDNVIILPTATPSDPGSKYKFVDWVLVDINGDPIEQDGVQFHYSVTHINLIDVIDYAIQNDNLGGAATDIYVLRLMPTWEKIKNPLHYNVALNWVDAQGKLHTEYFSEGWKEVLTDWNLDTSGNLTVQVIQEATPFKDWIANHPTYTFWDEVNTNNALYKYYQTHSDESDDPDFEDKAYAAMSEEMAKAIQTYLPSLTAAGMEQQYGDVLEALCTRDISGTDADGNPVKNGVKNGTEDFWRLGSYAYQVFEDYATIVVWMREDKGGLAFRKNVQPESFLLNDEFYFTVSQVMTTSGTPLNGTYKAYPQTVYDENGNKRDRLDSDAWLVTFTNGTITSIVKNDYSHASIKCFTLKHGEGIELYVPAGEYTITELGSKSGGTYRVEVKYDGKSGAPTLSSGWTMPEGNQWLKGQAKSYYASNNIPNGVSQVSATVYFEIGENNMVHTLQFNNMTATLSIEKILDATEENEKALAEWLAGNKNQSFHFTATLELPQGYTPLVKGTDYYFNMNIYSASGAFVRTDKLVLVKESGNGNTWTGEIDLMGGQRADVVMAPPNDGKTLYAHYYLIDDETGEPVLTPIEVTSWDNIAYLEGSTTPSYYPAVFDEWRGEYVYPYLYYLRDDIDIDDPEASFEESWIRVESGQQLQTATKYVGDTTISHKSGDTLYYEIGSNYLKLPMALSDVNLQLAMADNVYQVCEQKDVPLYYFPTKDAPLEPITEWNALVAAVNADEVYCEVDGNYYYVQLKEIEDNRADSGKSYEGCYQGVGGYRLKINCPVYVRDTSSVSSGHSPVLSLNEILVDVKTIDVPVSNDIISYSFKETWKHEEWEDSWNLEKQKTNLFIEEWIEGGYGVAETGKITVSKVVNWYTDILGDGYLAITQVDGDSNESFLYRITSTKTGESLTVSVKGGDVTYVYAPRGEYTVEEITDWAWRYEEGVCKNPNTGSKLATVTITAANDTPENAVHADYTNERNDKVWLGSESSKDNHFDDPAPSNEEQKSNSGKREYALLNVNDDEKKKRYDIANETEEMKRM